MEADHIPVVTKMDQGDPDSLWAKWRTDNADKLTISCYADETLSHCSFVAGYRAHEAVANAKKSPLTWQDISRILDLDQEVDVDIMVGDLPSLNP